MIMMIATMLSLFSILLSLSHTYTVSLRHSFTAALAQTKNRIKNSVVKECMLSIICHRFIFPSAPFQRAENNFYFHLVRAHTHTHTSEDVRGWCGRLDESIFNSLFMIYGRLSAKFIAVIYYIMQCAPVHFSLFSLKFTYLCSCPSSSCFHWFKQNSALAQCTLHTRREKMCASLMEYQWYGTSKGKKILKCSD